MLDSETILAPVSDDDPCGPDLEFDPDFIELERVAQGKPEQQYGDTIIPGEEPDWQEVERLSSGLLERTRDLRVLGHQAVALLHRKGVPAYSQVLCVMHELLAARWDTVHPMLDAEDNNDPTMRSNALLQIGHPGLVLRRLRAEPLVSSPRAGAITWRDVALATGVLTLEDENAEVPRESTIRAAFQDGNPATVQALRESLSNAVGAITAIGAVFDGNAGYGAGPDLSELAKLLRDMARMIERYGVAVAEDEAPADEPQDEAGGEAPALAEAAPRRGGASAASITEVSTRADAVRLLDIVCRYYQRYEPSSPLPMLIERARRLADKNFLEVLRDLAPDGLSQAETVLNPRED